MRQPVAFDTILDMYPYCSKRLQAILKGFLIPNCYPIQSSLLCSDMQAFSDCFS